MIRGILIVGFPYFLFDLIPAFVTQILLKVFLKSRMFYNVIHFELL